MDCLFCKIVKGYIPSLKVYEDEKVFVFLDIHPEANGHMLIIPKNHCQDLFDIDQETLLHVFEVAKKMDGILQESFHHDGLTLMQNNGCPQEVKHFHLHLIPKYIQEEDLVIKPVEEIYDHLKKEQ